MEFEVASSTVQLTDVAFGIALQAVLFAAMYYAGKKTDWFGEIKN